MLNNAADDVEQHPSDERLSSLVHGHEFEPDDLADIESHLEACTLCQTRAASLDGDPLVMLIRQSAIPRRHEAPRVTAGYELMAEAGRGAAGVVYQARQPGTGRIVAFKMLAQGVQASPSELSRFQREAQALARLDHPNVIKIFDVGEQEGVPYLAMEWIDGAPLSEYLKDRSPQPSEAAELIAKLAGGMAYVHQRGILHRDLKPQNVLLKSGTDEEGLRTPAASSFGAQDDLREAPLCSDSAKICDFGLARFAEGEGFHTRTGETLGTPSYMAPEQIGGMLHAITEKSDVYGLGAILYECLVGRPPFHGATPVETMQMVKDVEPVAISALRPNVPRDLEVICHRCLAKNPRDRFSTARELQQDLERYLENKPILSRPIPMYERTMRWARRNPWPVAVMGLMVVAVTIVIISGLRNARRLAEQRDEALRQYQASRAAIWEMLDAAGDESDFEIPRLQQLHTNQAATALKLFQSLSEQEGTQDAWMDLGRIQTLYGSGLVAQGKVALGSEQLEHSQKTFQQLYDLSPDNLDTLAGLVSAQVKLGYTLTGMEKTDQAIQILLATLPLARKLQQQRSEDVATANLVAWTHHNLGSTYVSAGQKQLAVAEFEAAVQIREQARQLDPQNDELLRFLAESQVSLAACEMGLGVPDVGRTYRQAIHTFDEIESRSPDDIEAVVSRGVAYLNYSNVLAGEDDADGAIDACTKGIVSIEKALSANPELHHAKNYVSMLYGNRGLFRSQVGETLKAIEDWRKAIEFSVVDAIRDFCRQALVRDLLTLSQIEGAVSQMNQFQVPRTDHDAQFQLATLWAEIGSASEPDDSEEAIPTGILQARQILQELSEAGYFTSHPDARDAVVHGENFRVWRKRTGIDAVERLLSAGE